MAGPLGLAILTWYRCCNIVPRVLGARPGIREAFTEVVAPE